MKSPTAKKKRRLIGKWIGRNSGTGAMLWLLRNRAMTKCSSTCLQRDKGGEVDPMHAAPPLVHFPTCLCMGIDFPSFGDSFRWKWSFSGLKAPIRCLLASLRLIIEARQANAKVCELLEEEEASWSRRKCTGYRKRRANWESASPCMIAQ